jgi:hypothetical protein
MEGNNILMIENSTYRLTWLLSQIPTDGLVLRGWYTTITLAVYGALTKGLAETIALSQTPAPSVVPPVSVTEGSPGHTEWGGQEVPPDYVAESQEHYPGSYPPEQQYQQQEYPPSYPDQWNSSQVRYISVKLSYK